MVRDKQVELKGHVLVADDHEVFRFGLVQLLSQTLGATKVIEAEDFDAALQRLADPELSLAIFDLGMPGLSGPAALLSVRQRRPDIKLVVLSASDARGDILSALEAGAHGYMVKTERTENLLSHLRYVLAGEIYVPPIVAELGAAGKAEVAHEAHHGNSDSTLSERQRDVLNLLVQGLSNKEIARALNLSEGTVKMHIAALFRALGASNRAHAAALGKHLLS